MEVKTKKIRYVACTTDEQEIVEQTLGSIEFFENYFIYIVEYTALTNKDEDDSFLGKAEEKIFNKDYVSKALIGSVCKLRTLTKDPMWKIVLNVSGCDALSWVFPLYQEHKCDEFMDVLIA